jgi:hypothetical protein
MGHIGVGRLDINLVGAQQNRNHHQMHILGRSLQWPFRRRFSVGVHTLGMG